MSRRAPEGPPPPPVVQRLRIRYAKRGRLRFASHRDFARAFERALRVAGAPMAYSAGFTPHPRISYVGAAPTGASSEAEYLEIGLAARVDPAGLAKAVGAALPEGFDLVTCVEAAGGGLPERIEASRWSVRLPGADPAEVEKAVAEFLAADRVPVRKRTKDGSREVDARSPVVSLTVTGEECVILDLVVRHGTPTVRPDDVVSGLRAGAPLELTAPVEATRLAQGLLREDGLLADPLDRDA